jgi:dihydrofolate reductase
VAEKNASPGAILIGKRMFDVGFEPWGDPPPFGMPVFIVTHEAREPLPMQGGTTYTFITKGIEAALELAREAAGDKDVGIWGGANIIQEYLKAGLLDEMQIHVVPVLFGDGTRLFEHLGGQRSLIAYLADAMGTALGDHRRQSIHRLSIAHAVKFIERESQTAPD